MKKNSILLILYIFLLLGIIYYIFFYQPSNLKRISEKDIIEDNKMEENVKQDSSTVNIIDKFPKVDKSVLNRFIIFIVLMSSIGYYFWKYTKQESKKVTKKTKGKKIPELSIEELQDSLTPEYTDIHKPTLYNSFTNNPYLKNNFLKIHNKTGKNNLFRKTKQEAKNTKNKNNNYPNAMRERNKLTSPINTNYIDSIWEDINTDKRRVSNKRRVSI